MAILAIDLGTPAARARVVGADGSTLAVTERSASARPEPERAEAER